MPASFVVSDASTSPLAVNAVEAAAMLGVSLRTLANWRTLGIGPSFVRVGRVHSRTLYRIDDLNIWLDNNRVETSGSKAVAS